jgi:hypothetical protein
MPASAVVPRSPSPSSNLRTNATVTEERFDEFAYLPRGGWDSKTNQECQRMKEEFEKVIKWVPQDEPGDLIDG